MPLYEYECQQCHRRVEKIQKFSDAPLTTCPHCSGALERTITAPAIQFKGAGWYKDLYSSAKPASAGSGTGESGSNSAGESKNGKADGGDKAATPAPSAAPAAASVPSSASGGGTSNS